MTKSQREHYRRTNISQTYLKIARGKRPKYLFMSKKGELYPYAIRSKLARKAHANPALEFIGVYTNRVSKIDLLTDIKEARQ